ncbi:unnamed protein product [Euphydryas editha]|uniref:Vanin C-terminal domain-containing protein n=1 Tax=Euphydryas editha TaxID=104508 RepID=A0AAU9UK17_EUPED|nr:unnamed protein product [Euphydryas editha]
MSFLRTVLCLLYCNLVLGSDTYRAAVVDVSRTDVSSRNYASLIREAGEINVDLLVLPNQKVETYEPAFDSCINGLNNYDEIVKSVSSAAKEAHIYVIAQLYEKARCQNRDELIRNNLVFDRNGAVVSVYRKPVNSASKCNTTITKMVRFTTDFGVTFGVLTEDDIILTSKKELNGIKNFVVSASTERTYIFAKQFSTFWAYTNNMNVITDNGKVFGNVDLIKSNNLLVADFKENGSNDISRTLVITPPLTYSTDLNQYIIRPLDLKASSEGYKQTICHGSLCCQFYVKTSFIDSQTAKLIYVLPKAAVSRRNIDYGCFNIHRGSKQDITFGLVVFDGVQQLTNNNIGVQTCAVVACASLYKRSCFIRSENNNTNIRFDKISISGNFTNDNTDHFPTILTTTQNVLNKDNFKFTSKNKNSKYISTELYRTENVLTFGIFGRDYSKDYETFEFGRINDTDYMLDFSEYISSENVQEFFDYLWIRLRILIFVVSIYILEMM